MAAAVLVAVPIIMQVLPDVIRIVQEMIQVFNDPELTPEQKAAKLQSLSARLDARATEVEAYKFREVPETPLPA